jgi:catechol 2,3-dioxygenase-like lactoylglutathione lyase family enzyme
MKMLRTAFTVSDVRQSLKFYRDVLGLSVMRDKIREGESYDKFLGFDNVKLRVVILHDESKNHLLELIQYLHPASQPNKLALNDIGAANVCFEVSDAKAVHRAMSDAGFHMLSKPIDFVQESVLAGWIFTAYDPDDIAVSILQWADNDTR